MRPRRSTLPLCADLVSPLFDVWLTLPLPRVDGVVATAAVAAVASWCSAALTLDEVVVVVIVELVDCFLTRTAAPGAELAAVALAFAATAVAVAIAVVGVFAAVTTLKGAVLCTSLATNKLA